MSDAADDVATDAVLDEIEQRLRGEPLVLLLDIDGTLCDIVPVPEDARVSDATRTLLERLDRLPNTHVVLVTGRGVDDARRVAGAASMRVYGNHGIEAAIVPGVVDVDAAAREAEHIVQSAVVALGPIVAQYPGAMLENKQYTLGVHDRHVAPERIDALRAQVRAIGDHYGLRVVMGNCIVELRPSNAGDKGSAVRHLARELGAEGTDAALLFAGDDMTDEDAMIALRTYLPHAVTIHVGGRLPETAAEYQLPTPVALCRLLTRVFNRRASEGGAPRNTIE
jgi:trehalose-phosphatase